MQKKHSKPNIIRTSLESSYAAMAKDRKREREATEWVDLVSREAMSKTDEAIKVQLDIK